MPDHEKHAGQSIALAERGDLATIQERHPDWPRLELSFYFAMHHTKSDTEGIAPHIMETDVVLYEDASRDEEFKAFFNEMAINPEKGLENVYWTLVKDTDIEPMVTGVKGTQKVAATIDIGKTTEEQDVVESLQDLLELSVPKGVEYSDAIQIWRERYAQIAALQSKREDIMVTNFEDEIEQILQSRPDLMQKDELKILISMGSYHTRLGHRFTKKGMKSDRHFPEKTYVYGYENEAVRSFAFHKDPSNELMRRALTEAITGTHIRKELRGRSDIESDTIVEYQRKMISALTTEDMEDIYDAYSEEYLTIELLDELLASRNLYRIPRSGDELIWELEEMSHKKKKVLAKTAIRG